MIGNRSFTGAQDEGVQARAPAWFRLTLWAAALAAVAFLVIWPLVAGMVSCCDDVNYSRVAQVRGTLGDNFSYWWHAHVFRPADLFSICLVNAETLDARPALLLHLPALVAILGAMWVALKRLTPHHRLYFPLAVLLWCLHLATNVAFWQHDTIAQTWVAACGLWLGLLVWEAIERAWAGKSLGRQLVTILLICVLGVLSKEIFYSWIATMGALLLVTGMVALRRGQKQVLVPLGCILLVVIVVPLCFVAVRWFAGGMSMVTSERMGRYHMQFGLNVIRNAVMAALGYFLLAPIHVLRDPRAPLLLKLVPLLAIGLNFLLCAGPWFILWRRHRDWPARPSGTTMAAIVLVTFFSVSATLPMGQISELYLLGPNVGAVILLTISLAGWWHLLGAGSTERVSGRWNAGRLVLVGAALVLIACGVYGVASRSYHFRVTWTYAAELNRVLLDHQRSLPADKNRVINVYLPPACTEGLVHSQYVETPLDALCAGKLYLKPIETWFNRHDPLRRMRLVWGRQTAPLAPGDLVLDCAGLPHRQHW